MTPPMMLALLLLLIGVSAVIAALAASPPQTGPHALTAVEERHCGSCAAHTLHLIDTAGVGLCAGCRTENPRTHTTTGLDC